MADGRNRTDANYPILATEPTDFPVERRVANVGHPTYNMQGSYEAFARHGVPQVVVQRSPYARIAYEYGPGGVTPLVGATSVYPHVLYGGYRDYLSRYTPTIPEGHPALSVDFNSLMDRIERMTRLSTRGSGSGGSGSAQPKRGLKNSGPGDEAINQPLPGTEQPAAETPAATPAPATATPTPPVAAPIPDDSAKYGLHPGIGMQDDIDATEDVVTYTGPKDSELIEHVKNGGGFLDWIMGNRRTSPKQTQQAVPQAAPSRPSAYETIAVDPSDWNLDYINTLNGLLDALGESGVTAPVTPAPAYTGPTLIRVRPQNAW